MKKLLIALVATFAVGSVSFANEAAPAAATGDTAAQGTMGGAPEAATETKTEEGMKAGKKGKKKKDKKKPAKAEETTM